ncbi:MAG TPA: cytochrome c oxidase accessory protein CcoG [Bacteroidales bacterium]|nr:cytochrome c oxidase accessory protein CcoG [Bacteroidales bacterium]
MTRGNQIHSENESFRDKLATVGEGGKRIWIYPKRPKGKFYAWRWAVAIVLLSFLFIAPWLKFEGEQFLLLNVLQRKFILFGHIFWPQDFHLIVLGFITLIVFIILFTVIFGRLFCGWACPQTIFMEFVFRQIEYLIEGDAHQQKKLARQPWNFDKLWRKTTKHAIFFLIAFFISNTFLAYLIGSDRLKTLVFDGPLPHLSTFIPLVIFSGVFYFVFAFFREQVCMIACPYGRLQGVLLDNKSMVVAYDYKRGEPRGKHNPLEKRETTGKGDCIDCSSCIVVCPTGIDIRNGTQLECINCTACIDACNSIMDKVKLPRGLIRHTSEKGIAEGHNKLINPRSIAYSAVLLILVGLMTSLFFFRSDIEATMLRVPGTMFQEYGPDHLSNIYKVQLVNKTRNDINADLRIDNHSGEIIVMGGPIIVPGGQITEANFLVVIHRDSIRMSSTPLQIGVYSDDKLIDRSKITFIAPNTIDKK